MASQASSSQNALATLSSDADAGDGDGGRSANANDAAAATTKVSKATSCNECRRLKLRCSKTWPCDMCVKRRLAHLCPDGVQKRERPKATGGPSAGRASSGDAYGDVAATDGNAAVWTRLSSLEQKLDLLLADRGLHTPSAAVGSANSRGSSSGLHDLANVATDHRRLIKDSDSPGQRHGLLAMHADGRSSYVGPHAHSVYLAREGLQAALSGTTSPNRPPASRLGSPTPVDLDAVAASHNAAHKALATGLDEETSPIDTLTPSNSDSQTSMMAWATPGFRSPHSSAAIWTHLRPMLPSKDVARRLVEVYFASLSFMHEHVSREEMELDIWPAFYDDSSSSNEAIGSATPPALYHPHKMSILFAILALGVLLDVKRPQRDPVGRALYSCAWKALVLANFTESTSLDALVALVHIALYLTWRRAGRYAESAWPLFGIMTSMMTRSGLHRDPEYFDVPDAVRERRRRVFWDLHGVEVLRALAFCRPPAIRDPHIDTRLPAAWRLEREQERIPATVDEQAGAFHAAKCKQTRLINRILDECLCATSTYPMTIEYDARIRQLFRSYPAWMAPAILPLSQRSKTGVDDMEATYHDKGARDALLHTMRCHLTHLNTHQLRLLLHRGWFSEALQQIGEMESDGGKAAAAAADGGEDTSGPSTKRKTTRTIRFQASVDAVNHSATHVIELVTSVWSHYPALVIRWMFFWNGLFSAAVCRGLYAVKRRKGGEAHAAWRDLRAAISLLRLAVDEWKPLEQPLGILLRLDHRAAMALGSAAGTGGGGDAARSNGAAAVVDYAQAAAEAADAARAASMHGEDMSLIGDAHDARRSSSRGGKRASHLVPDVADHLSRPGKAKTGKRVRIKQDDDGNVASTTADASFEPPSLDDLTSQLLPASSTFDTVPFMMHAAHNGSGSSGDANSSSQQQIDFSLFSPHDMTMPASLPAFQVGGMAGNVHDDVLSAHSSSMPAFASLTPAAAPASSSSLSAAAPTSSADATFTMSGGASNASQLLQMLSAGVGWEDVTSWDTAIFDL